MELGETIILQPTVTITTDKTTYTTGDIGTPQSITFRWWLTIPSFDATYWNYMPSEAVQVKKSPVNSFIFYIAYLLYNRKHIQMRWKNAEER